MFIGFVWKALPANFGHPAAPSFFPHVIPPAVIDWHGRLTFHSSCRPKSQAESSGKIICMRPFLGNIFGQRSEMASTRHKISERNAKTVWNTTWRQEIYLKQRSRLRQKITDCQKIPKKTTNRQKKYLKNHQLPNKNHVSQPTVMECQRVAVDSRAW